MKSFIDFIRWFFGKDEIYCRVCTTCLFIHYEDVDGNAPCCVCERPTMKVEASRAKQWQREARTTKRMIAALEAEA